MTAEATLVREHNFLLETEHKRGIWHLTLRLMPNVEAKFILQSQMAIDCIDTFTQSIYDYASGYAAKINFFKEHAHSNLAIKKTYTIHKRDTLLDKISEFIETGFSRIEKSVEKRRQQKLYEEMIASKPYHQFMYHAANKRKVTCYIAPTNAGKSYFGRELLTKNIHPDYGQSVILLPLRALAIENHLDLTSKGVPTSLITGEERNVNPVADVICQTIETFDSQREYNSIMIDEAQLTFAPDRGSSYLEAIVAARCKEIILTAAPESREQIKSLFDLLGEQVDFVELERLCPLMPLENPVTIEQVKKGDLVIAFSAKKVHHLAKLISEQGLKVGTLYGAMSPSARRHMMRHYHEGEIDVMVSTDAIGMGANFPVDRCLFTENQKFDGEEVRKLTIQEMKQIAGRAGRFGIKEKGEYGTLVGFFDNDDFLEELVEAVESEPKIENLTQLFALPNKHAFKASPLSLERTLHAWINATSKGSHLYEKSPRLMHEIKMRCSILQDQIKKGIINRDDGINLLFIAFNLEKHMEFFLEIIAHIHQGKLIHVAIPENATLRDLEDTSELLAIASQLQRVYPEFSEPEDIINNKQSIVGKEIYNRLIELYA